ncbi:MAG: formate C-acetyltransferase [Candidatus Roizmanbacteria bacterium]
MNNQNKLKYSGSIDVRDFVLQNITPFEGDSSFLSGPSERTKKLWNVCLSLLQEERVKKVLDIDTSVISTINSHDAGYVDKDQEVIVGLQTDAPLKRGIKPHGGIRIVEKACAEYGRSVAPEIVEIFNKYRKSHNDGIFAVYTEEIRLLRSLGILTGLPDNYARGRIIGDYRRLALYGSDKLIEEKEKDKTMLSGDMTDELIRLREEISEQIVAIKLIKDMAQRYGYDVSVPAKNALEAIQWTYFAYLAGIKEHDGAAMSMGNVSNFFDIYIERDLQSGLLTEEGAQELVDQFVIKLRLVRHLRMDEYNKIFAGDPTWVTESIGGTWVDGTHKVTKTSYRFLQTLYNLGPSPEPNLTVLWSDKLPESFRKFCAQVSIDTSSIQYENDDLMREVTQYDDYGISCCVSLIKTGKQMQFFGARCNLAKTLLLAINEGRDEIKGVKVVEGISHMSGEFLDYEEVKKSFAITMKYIAHAYVNTMNIIHYMHDKYYYERAQMAFLDSELERVMAFGIAGLSVVTDSLSAIKYAKVKPIRNEKGIATDFEIVGEYPKYGNDDDRVDDIAKSLVDDFNLELHKHHIYRDAEPTLSVLTITSNVMYGKKTGATPDGRKAGAPFSPGANPMHGRDTSGAIASLNSVAKLSYEHARDGISNTFSVVPKTLGSERSDQIGNLVSLICGYFLQKAHHLNVNVLNKETLLDAMDNPEKYPQLTIRVSGYAVNFIKLSREQQQEVLNRTFFETM